MALFASHARWAAFVMGPRGRIELKRFSTHKAARSWLADMCGYAASVNAHSLADAYSFAARQFGHKRNGAKPRALKVGSLIYTLEFIA